MSILQQQTFLPSAISTPAEVPNLPRDWRAYQPWLLPLLGLAVALFLPLHWCWARWGELNSPQSYQPLVPIGAAWLAWQRRAEVSQARSDAGPQAKGVGQIGLILAGGLVLMLGHVMQLGMLGVIGAVIALAGVVQCVYGTMVLRVLAVPFGFLLLTAPLPNSILGPATARLQMVCTQGAGHALLNLGVPNHVAGNLIFLKDFQLEVIAPCSGISIVFPVVVLTLWVMLTRRANPFLTVAALVPAAVIALAMNVLRITSVGLVGSVNPYLARTLHDPISWLFTGLAFGLTWWLIGRTRKEATP
jgi:exosortase